MKKPSPIVIIASGLIILSCAIVLMGDFFFSYLPDRQVEKRHERQRIANTIAIPVLDLLSQGELNRLTTLLNDFVRQDTDIMSAAIRKHDGNMLTSTINHFRHWTDAVHSDNPSSYATVPIDTTSGSWGAIELVFEPNRAGFLAVLHRQPGLALLLSIVAFGAVAYGLYMKRVLRQFDPNTVIPERVRVAFDAMTEGVVIVDGEGRIALTNDKFREMGYTPDPKLTATRLSEVRWLRNRLSEHSDYHPWTRSMREQQPIVGEELTPNSPGVDDEHIIVNCAPIVDSRNEIRGCMVTFDNITELHQVNQQLGRTLEELRASRREVEEKAADLQRLANVDYLTGVLNRRAFTEKATEIFSVASQQRHVFSCVMIDIDHFKTINDTFGHGVGDIVIQSVADILMANTRDEDLVGRLGGEEFCIALPNSGQETAMEVALRIRIAVESQIVDTIKQLDGHTVTASLGVAVYNKHHKDLLALVESSDKALYEAKESGRNKVCLADSSNSVPA